MFSILKELKKMNTNSTGFDNISNKAVKVIKQLLINYRPISFLPVISKIFKKVIHKQLLNYFIHNKLFSDYQYGFRPKHCTEHAALQFHDHIIHQLDIGKTPFSICIDLSKAFDTIDHSILIKIL